jgi:hypothetical protein
MYAHFGGNSRVGGSLSQQKRQLIYGTYNVAIETTPVL